MIALDDNGNFVTDGAGHLTVTATPLIQCAKSELRCQQGEWISDFFFSGAMCLCGESHRALMTGPWILTESFQNT